MESGIKELILRRKTSKPANFSDKIPEPALIRELIEVGRHAPNHHRTEPARFYLLDQERIKEVGRLFGEVVAGDGSDPALIQRGEKKAREWGSSPGLLIVTCHTDLDSELARKKPEIIEETTRPVRASAKTCFSCSRAREYPPSGAPPVFDHPEFTQVIGMQSPDCESMVALLFYGYSETGLPERTYSPLDSHLRDFTA